MAGDTRRLVPAANHFAIPTFPPQLGARSFRGTRPPFRGGVEKDRHAVIDRIFQTGPWRGGHSVDSGGDRGGLVSIQCAGGRKRTLLQGGQADDLLAELGVAGGQFGAVAVGVVLVLEAWGHGAAHEREVRAREQT